MIQSHRAAALLQWEADIDALMQQMTLAEKIGQMTQVEKNSITPAEAAAHNIGSILSGGGGNPTPNAVATWGEMARAYLAAALTTRLRIPLIYGVDAVHGHANAYGTPVFPHNIGLGATRDPELVRQIGAATARELLAVGVHWNFAPAVSVPQDVRWGRTYEGYAEETALVTEMSLAYLTGLQDESARVLGSVKHYIGDGSTAWGTTTKPSWVIGNWQAPGDSYSLDQGDYRGDEASFRALHLPPYRAAIEAGAVNIMVSFNSYHGEKMHGSRYWLTDVLKGELGFVGFLVSDWAGVDQIDPDYHTSVVTAINAGLDMVMVPYDYKNFIGTLTKAVEDGEVSQERIDDAVRRILRAKYWLGVFEQPLGRPDLLSSAGSREHREIARAAVRESAVLLKNDGALPVSKSASLLIAGRGADNIGMQCGGWTIEWLGKHGAITPGTSVLTGIDEATDPISMTYNEAGAFEGRADVGIVVIGENPYAEGWGDSATLTLPETDLEVVRRMRPHVAKLIVVLLSGRPVIIDEVLATADGVIAAWLPGTEGAGVADVLVGDYPFTGKLSYTWMRSVDQLPRATLLAHPDGALFPFGYGL